MCPKRTRHRALSQANTRAPISGLFVFRPFVQSSIVLPYFKIELLKNRRTANILSGFIVVHNIYRQPPASRWAQAPSHLQHPASLDSQREDAHSAGFHFFDESKMTVLSSMPLEPAVMYFDTTDKGTRWKILANISSDEFSVEILPGVFAVFFFTGARRLFRNQYFGLFQLSRITEERSKVQGRLVSLGGVLTLQQEVP